MTGRAGSNHIRYRTIVADPPWPQGERPGWAWRDGRPSGHARALPYATMTLEEIIGLPVRRLADYEAHLYLWTTNRYLWQAFGVAAGWGFSDFVTLVWCKESRGFAPGGRFQNNTEFIVHGTAPAKSAPRVQSADVAAVCAFLADAAGRASLSPRDVDRALGTKAMARVFWLSRDPWRCSCPNAERWEQLRSLLGFGPQMDATVAALNAAKGATRQVSPRSEPLVRETSRWFRWQRGSHSSKPEAFMDMVERVSPGPYLELFARRQRLGWDTWGDEALDHVGRLEDTP